MKTEDHLVSLLENHIFPEFLEEVENLAQDIIWDKMLETTQCQEWELEKYWNGEIRGLREIYFNKAYDQIFDTLKERVLRRLMGMEEEEHAEKAT